MIDNLTEAISHAKEEREKVDKTLKYWESINAPLSEQIKYEIGQCKDKLIQCDQTIAWLTELQERREADRWTPVSEGLPEEKKDTNTNDFAEVLCTTIFGGVRLYKYGTRIGDKQAHFWYGYGIFDSEIIAWKPLPKPYESEDK